MKLILIMSLFLSSTAMADGCFKKYKTRLKASKSPTKEKIRKTGDALMVAGIVSSAPLITSAATPGMVLLGLASYAGGGYLSNDITNEQQKYGQAYSLLKDSKIKKGYYLQDGTAKVRSYFADASITEKEVSAAVNSLAGEGAFCKNDEYMNAGDMLLLAGKRIIATRGVLHKSTINDAKRGYSRPFDDEGGRPPRDNGKSHQQAR